MRRYDGKQRVLGFTAAVLAAVFVLGALVWYGWRGQGMRFVRQMGAGINLGNALDVTDLRQYMPDADVQDYETFWHNPAITKELLRAIRSKGFGTVRIPVSWDEHLLPDGGVDPEWMDRVEQVVDWALECGLYVILDLHHESWLVPTPEAEQQVTRRLCSLWGQIARRFADRDEKLLFEAMNEPRLTGSGEEWTAGTSEMRAVVNRLNAAFVATVRAAGGYNERRWLVLPAYGTQYREEALEDLVLPDSSHLMVAVHAYLPYAFALGGTTAAWSGWNPRDTQEIDALIERLCRLFLRRQIPVLITEFGCGDQENLEERLAWARYYARSAARAGIGCIWWDDGSDMQLIDRATCEWTQPELAEVLVGEASRSKGGIGCRSSNF